MELLNNFNYIEIIKNLIENKYLKKDIIKFINEDTNILYIIKLNILKDKNNISFKQLIKLLDINYAKDIVLTYDIFLEIINKYVNNNLKEITIQDIKNIEKNLREIHNITGKNSLIKKKELILNFLNKPNNYVYVCYYLSILIKMYNFIYKEKYIIECIARIYDINKIDLLKLYYNDKMLFFNNIYVLKEYINKNINNINEYNYIFPFSLAHIYDKKLLKKYDCNEEKYIFIQPKYDGMRIMIYKYNDSIKLLTRNNNNIIKRFNLFLQLKNIEENFIIDGELISEKGFNTLMSIGDTKKNKKENIDKKNIDNYKMIVFDILKINDDKLYLLNYEKRLDMLERFIKKFPNLIELVSYEKINNNDNNIDIENIFKNKYSLYEGLIIKNPYSIYEFKRSNNLLKFKLQKTIDVLIKNIIKGKAKHISNIILEAYILKNNDLYHICNIATGLSEDMTSHLLKEYDYCLKNNKDLIVEIYYQELSITNNELSLRFPSFLKIRKDKEKKDIDTYENLISQYQNNCNL